MAFFIGIQLQKVQTGTCTCKYGPDPYDDARIYVRNRPAAREPILYHSKYFSLGCSELCSKAHLTSKLNSACQTDHEIADNSSFNLISEREALSDRLSLT